MTGSSSHKRVETSGPAETEAVGRRLADDLVAGDLVFVSGEVGTGKTTLVRGACRGLGVRDDVVSPTFTIGRRYDEGRLPVSHLDLYRLAGLEGEDPGLLADYISPDRVAFVEWPEHADARLGDVTLRIAIAHRGGDRRLIEVTRP
ncbi:MAG: tRNA threonylcarbamoyladenosine biosynthesis protein TsaE [Solirubrobacteraceae bacterium]|jgi:tRNA threonylcarbamoyladenosine biosynthesis protein TsaE|nr:tRNA threonylcarbamoyladenosine biosynthesis protein TsaE [Solirubrobacteraceae bacterium]